MEYENDNVKTLEERMAQIEEWKRCKDDAEYRAKVKAENEYWEAVNNLKKYHKRIEDICTLMDKLYSYQICSPGGLGTYCDILSLRSNTLGGSRHYFGKIIYDKWSANTDHYVLYDMGDGEFHYCTKNSSGVFNPTERFKPETEVLVKIYESFPEFEKNFYSWLDKKTKI